MKTLFLLRHAKSGWALPGSKDLDRPLNDEGWIEAEFMGKLICRKRFQPSIIICSPALRTAQTVSSIRYSGRFDAEIFSDGRIYEASPDRLVQVLSEQDKAAESILIVGHNPGIEGLIHLLTGQPTPIPTAALAVMRLHIDDWKAIHYSRANLVDVFSPED